MGSERISEGPPVVQADKDRSVHQEVAHALSLARAALESTTDGLLVVDHEGRIVISNQRFLELWRIPAELAARGVDAEVLAFVVEQLVDPAAFVAKVTGGAFTSSARSFLDRIANETVEKPFEVRALRALVARFLR